VQYEFGAVRMTLDDAVDVVRGSVVPAVCDQEGYGGMYLLLANEGKALAISLWTTAEAAEAGTVDSRPLYDDQSRRSRPSTELRPVARRTASRWPTRPRHQGRALREVLRQGRLRSFDWGATPYRADDRCRPRLGDPGHRWA
jgi:hypothetical protein